MSGEPPLKSPLDRLLDASVYAPVGFLTTRDETVRDLAAAGRKQVAFTRSLGRAALKGLARGRQADPANAPHPADAPVTPVKATAVDGYTTMSARELVAFVSTCTAAEAAWLHTAEQDGKNRVTVIRALDARMSGGS